MFVIQQGVRWSNMESIYEPNEDSYFFQKYVMKYARGDVLDMGTGSGIQATSALQVKSVRSVLATDVNKQAVKYVNDLIKKDGLKKIKVIHSDLFSNIPQNRKFDTIIFNPPYLPDDEMEPEGILKRATTGGKNGWESIEAFFGQALRYLKENGRIYLVFSSLTSKEKVEEIIKLHLLDFEVLGQKKIDFETLYVYSCHRSRLLETFEKYKITEVRALAKGKRGVVYYGKMKGREVAVKIMNPKSKAGDRIQMEINWLKRLNAHGIGPKLIAHNHDFFIMEFCRGLPIVEYIDSMPSDQPQTKSQIKKVLCDVFKQCYKMDELKVEKLEMHTPHKHIIVGNTVKMIDFERARHNPNPKNVTQFCQFVTSTNVFVALREKGFTVNRDRIRKLCQWYKSNANEKNLERIMKELK